MPSAASAKFSSSSAVRDRRRHVERARPRPRVAGARLPASRCARATRRRASPPPRPPRAAGSWAARTSSRTAPTTSPANRIVPWKRHVDPGRAEDLLRPHALGLAGEQPRAGDAVAADVHQRAAVELRARAGCRPASAGRTGTTPARAGRVPTAPSSTSSLTAAVCGWWRYMNASISTSPAARRGRTPPRPRRAGASTASRRGRACPHRVPRASTRGGGGSGARCRRRRPRRRRAAPRRSRGSGRSRARAAYASARAPSLLPTATTSTRSVSLAPPRIASLILAVESRPSLMTTPPRRRAAGCARAARAARRCRRRSPRWRASISREHSVVEREVRGGRPAVDVAGGTRADDRPGDTGLREHPRDRQRGGACRELVRDRAQAVDEREAARDLRLLERGGQPAPVVVAERRESRPVERAREQPRRHRRVADHTGAVLGRPGDDRLRRAPLEKRERRLDGVDVTDRLAAREELLVEVGDADPAHLSLVRELAPSSPTSPRAAFPSSSPASGPGTGRCARLRAGAGSPRTPRGSTPDEGRSRSRPPGGLPSGGRTS